MRRRAWPCRRALSFVETTGTSAIMFPKTLVTNTQTACFCKAQRKFSAQIIDHRHVEQGQDDLPKCEIYKDITSNLELPDKISALLG